jgi:hypothetical protein
MSNVIHPGEFRCIVPILQSRGWGYVSSCTSLQMSNRSQRCSSSEVNRNKFFWGCLGIWEVANFVWLFRSNQLFRDLAEISRQSKEWIESTGFRIWGRSEWDSHSEYQTSNWKFWVHQSYTSSNSSVYQLSMSISQSFCRKSALDGTTVWGKNQNCRVRFSVGPWLDWQYGIPPRLSYPACYPSPEPRTSFLINSRVLITALKW